MKPFSKTYYTDKLSITIRIKRHELCSMGCRLTIKDISNKTFRGASRILYTWFPNNKDMFGRYKERMTNISKYSWVDVSSKTKVPRTTINEIIDDIKKNLMFEKVVTYQPIEKKMLWD
jgi:hypothetical protein